MQSCSLPPYQYTLKKAISCCGIGLHSGRTVNLVLKPAAENNGIVFFRKDLSSSAPIKAHMDKIIDTRLATKLGEGKSTVSTTEHLLAALRCFGIDNAEIELDAGEVPIMDGSAAPFINLLKSAGKTRQKSFRKVLRIKKPITCMDGDKKISVTPYDGLRVSGEICFDDELISNQAYDITVTQEHFINEISRARTFGYIEQVEEMWANGLALGGSLDNVIAIHWNRKTVLNEDGLRYRDEFIRHKILDLLGDISLLGCPIMGHITAYKAGHTQHAAFMKAIAAAPDSWELIELSGNGSYSVLDSFISGTRTAGGKIFLPFLPKAARTATAVAA